MAFILPRKNEPGVMLEEGCEMVGNLCLLLAMGLYARHAVLAYEAAAAPAPSRAPLSSPRRRAA
jgi:hypothetical protein